MMPSAGESVCCSEKSWVVTKRTNREVDCIAVAPRCFKVCVCFDPWAIETAYYGYAVEGVSCKNESSFIFPRSIGMWCIGN